MRNFYERHTGIFRLLAAALIVVLLLISQTAFWLHRNIYDTEKFTQIATQSITLPSSRQAVGDAIVNRALADRPVVRSTVGPRLSGVISGLLGTDFATSVTEKLVERIQITLTTPRREPIVIDTTGIKQIISSIQATLSRSEEETKIDPDQIPDEIMVVDTSKIPNFHEIGIVVLWLGPLSLAIALGLLVSWVLKAKIASARLVRIRIALGLFMTSCLLALLVGPLAKPPFLSSAENAGAQTLLANIYDGFLAPFNQQARNLGVFVTVLFVVTFVWGPLVRKLQQLSLPKQKAPQTKAKQPKDRKKAK